MLMASRIMGHWHPLTSVPTTSLMTRKSTSGRSATARASTLNSNRHHYGHTRRTPIANKGGLNGGHARLGGARAPVPSWALPAGLVVGWAGARAAASARPRGAESIEHLDADRRGRGRGKDRGGARRAGGLDCQITAEPSSPPERATEKIRALGALRSRGGKRL